MAVTQYVGARYVPKFADPVEWQPNTTYEPLTIVSYNNASYTSKVQVPVNVNPTNEQYWALTGNYNGQVEEYRQEVVELMAEVADYKKNIDANTESIKKANGIGNRNFILIGDSYSVNWETPSQPYTKGWMGKLSNYLNSNGYGTVLRGKSGGGFEKEGEYNFQTILETTTTNLNITDILVAAGYNDGNGSGVVNSITGFCNKAKELYPNAKIWIAHIGWTVDSLKWTYYKQGKERYREGAIRNGAAYIEEAGNVMYNFLQDEYATYPSFDITNVWSYHPSEYACDKIAYAIESALMGGTYLWSIGSRRISVVTEEGATNSTLAGYSWADGYIAHAEFPLNGVIYFANPKNIICDGNYIKIGTLYNCIVRGGVAEGFSNCSIGYAILQYGNNVEILPCKFALINEDLYFACNIFDAGWKTLEGVTQINIGYMKFEKTLIEAI